MTQDKIENIVCPQTFVLHTSIESNTKIYNNNHSLTYYSLFLK